MKFQLHYDGFGWGDYTFRLSNFPKNLIKCKVIIFTAGICALETTFVCAMTGQDSKTVAMPIIVKNTFNNELVTAAYRYYRNSFQLQNGKIPDQITQIFQNQNCTKSYDQELSLVPVYNNLLTSTYHCHPVPFPAADIIYPLTVGSDFNISIEEDNCFKELTNKACQLALHLSQQSILDSTGVKAVGLTVILGGALAYGFFRRRPQQNVVAAPAQLQNVVPPAQPLTNNDINKDHSPSCQPD